MKIWEFLQAVPEAKGKRFISLRECVGTRRDLRVDSSRRTNILAIGKILGVK